MNFTAPAGAVVVLDAERRLGRRARRATRRTRRACWVGGISQTDFDAITNPASNYPLVNRATQGQYAPGSTFKLVTSLAMTHDGIRGIGDYYTDEGKVEIGDSTFRNANDEAVRAR